MDCGVPFCQSDTGCPVQNVIPEWNDLVHTGPMARRVGRSAFDEQLSRAHRSPVSRAVRVGLRAVADRSAGGDSEHRAEHRRSSVSPKVGSCRDRRSARPGGASPIVGSGPAGLAAAQQLRRAGHSVVVFERADRLGGLLRYGIPEFKLEKSVLDRRLAQLEAEGVEFRTGVDVGDCLTVDELRREYDAVCVATGAGVARELPVAGRELKGVHLAMDFLAQQNRRNAGERIDPASEISAAGKHVVIIGGGDTGSDCAGTCLRQGAKSVHQFELMPQPPLERSTSTPWPLWPMQLRTSHAHEEGCERDWSVATTAFSGDAGSVMRLHGIRVATNEESDGSTRMLPVADSEFTIDADLVLLAMGFSGVERGPCAAELGVDVERGMIGTPINQATRVPGVFAAGDARRGASLIVWAIREGRDAAEQIDRHLRERTQA